VKIEFFPEQHFVEAVLAYIRSTGHAFALFDLARSFLVKQDRHRVKISGNDPAVVLYQAGERGPVSLDEKLAEKTAFQALRKQFYTEEVVEREPLKGNFTNVARCRLSGEILGPTSHHSYQVALRKHYEQRFSRRMSFNEFLREIETSTKPEDIEAWKESSRKSTVYKTIGEGEPVEFSDLAQVEAHFRKNHLPNLLKNGASFEMSGAASRSLADRRVSLSVQSAWEKERGFPGQMMYHLREQFVRAGLHFFKHHKRQQFISIIRPQPIKAEGLSENIRRVLRVLEEKPGCTRAELAQTLLDSEKDNPELPKLKAALAADLHWLRQAGNIIEFSDGKIDLPRKKNEEDAPQGQHQGGAGGGRHPKQPKAPAKQAEKPESKQPETTTEPEKAQSAGSEAAQHESPQPEEPAAEPAAPEPAAAAEPVAEPAQVEASEQPAEVAEVPPVAQQPEESSVGSVQSDGSDR
jgi:hypothetical protein